jgi:hypothetical protein
MVTLEWCTLMGDRAWVAAWSHRVISRTTVVVLSWKETI